MSAVFLLVQNNEEGDCRPDRRRARLMPRPNRDRVMCPGTALPGIANVDRYPSCPVCGLEFSAQGRKAQARLGNCWLSIPRHYACAIAVKFPTSEAARSGATI